MDDASTDDSVDQARRRFAEVHFVSHLQRMGASPTKHRASLEASGEVLVFLDGHTNPEPGSIERLVQGIEELNGQAILTPAVTHLDPANWSNSRSQVGHGYSVQLDTLACRWLPLRELPIREFGRRRFRESPALIGCALAISAQLYRQLNGFDAEMLYWGVRGESLF